MSQGVGGFVEGDVGFHLADFDQMIYLGEVYWVNSNLMERWHYNKLLCSIMNRGGDCRKSLF